VPFWTETRQVSCWVVAEVSAQLNLHHKGLGSAPVDEKLLIQLIRM